jgi:hypothetical protein
MKTIDEKFEAIKALSAAKDQVEDDLKNILHQRDIINSITGIAFEKEGKPYVIDLPTELINRILVIIQTHLTTRREQVICEAEKLIGPVEHEEPKENETAPLNQ